MPQPTSIGITEASDGTITEYVVGFLFDPDRRDVLLIQKTLPAWQVGRLNGIGGHIDPHEKPLDAMAREFAEEAGVSGLSWEPVSILSGDQFCVHFFAAFDASIYKAWTVTDEKVLVERVAGLCRRPLLPNLALMIALALDQSGIIKPVRMFDRRSREGVGVMEGAAGGGSRTSPSPGPI